MSHPVWVCGLKLLECSSQKWQEESHPVWVCGLKLSVLVGELVVLVTPCMGVWIETARMLVLIDLFQSHPVWVCGLKLSLSQMQRGQYPSHPVWVCGLKLCQILAAEKRAPSHPVWVCGLKL